MTAIEMGASRTIWDVGTLPFHLGPLPRRHVAGFPERMPFRVGYDETLGLITQVSDERVVEALRQVYARGSQLGIPMGDHGLGKAYAGDFEGVIRGWLGGDLASMDVLEIGCGAGHLLGTLADAGARPFGVEPDPRCAEAMRQRGIPVATCELEQFEPDRGFDAVVHYCVWEHARDPVDFLARQKALLQPGGRVICAVPDCTDALAMGDISIFIHQHWSYFTAASLRRVAAAAGLQVERLRAATVGGVLYASLVDAETDPAGCSAAPDKTRPAADVATGAPIARAAAAPIGRAAAAPTGRAAAAPTGRAVAAPTGRDAAADDAGEVDAEDLVARCRRAMARFVRYVRGTHERGRSLGIYCPARAINYVPEGDGVVAAPRLFDDSPLLHGKFMPPFTAAVEGGEGLERQGVDEILIMSRSFREPIEAAVRERRATPAPAVRHIDDVLADV